MIRTLPELARAWWLLEEEWPGISTTKRIHTRPLAPVYRVKSRWSEERRVRALAQAIGVINDRLSRLPRVWHEWEEFDPGAFFDLYPEQVDVLVDIQASRRRVRVTFYADLLVPSFQEAETFWVNEVIPALHVAQPSLLAARPTGEDPASEVWAQLVARELGPEMEQRLYRAAQEIQAVRNLLYERGDVTFLATMVDVGDRERLPRPVRGGQALLAERLRLIPTLTLQLTFPTNLREQQARGQALRRWLRRSWHRSRAK